MLQIKVAWIRFPSWECGFDSRRPLQSRREIEDSSGSTMLEHASIPHVSRQNLLCACWIVGREVVDLRNEESERELMNYSQQWEDVKTSLRPWGYESPSRQKRKSLPFQRLQPPRIFEHFTFLPIFYQLVIPHVLLILSTNWPQRQYTSLWLLLG